jgi:hypothetical protein
MRNKLKLVAPVSEWQKWPRGYVPTDKQLEQMTEDEYDAWANYEYKDCLPQSINHPSLRLHSQ